MSFTKISSECIKDSNIRPKAVKFLEEKAGENLLDKSLGNDLLDTIPTTEAVK